jgi:hypothetical protein
VAFLLQRTAPLGLALMAPVMVNMVLADTLLDTVYLWAAAHAAPFVALCWRYRSAFRPLWSDSAPAGAGTESAAGRTLP